MNLFIILQEPTTTLFEPIIKEWFSYGAVGLTAATFIYLYFKERNKNNKIIKDENNRIIADSEKEKQRLIAEAEKEKMRLIAEAENSNEKVEVLYNKLEQFSSENNSKLYDIITKQNELSEKNIEALIRNSEIIQKSNVIHEQLMSEFIKYSLNAK